MSSSSTQAVLLVGRNQLRLLVQDPGDSEPRWSTLELSDQSARTLATTAKAELQELGFKGKKIILALDSELTEQKRIVVPPLPRKERNAVWSRRAANLLECDPKQAVYLSVPLARGEERADDTGDPWLLFALERSWLYDLQFELRRSGLSVSRVALVRLALLEWSSQQLQDDTTPFLLVARERSATTLSLLCAGDLIQQTVLATRGDEDMHGAAVALVQELRVLSSHWRKMSRGKELGRIALLGFTTEFLEPLVAAIHAALGGVEIKFLSEGDDDSENAQSLELLQACLADGPLQANLSLVLPPRPIPAIAVSTALAAIAAVAGIPFMEAGEQRLSKAKEQVAQLENQSADLDTLRQLEIRHATAAQGLEEEIARWTELKLSTIPIESLLPELFGAFEGRAEIASLQARTDQGVASVKVSGVTRGNPQEVYATLEQLRVDLEQLKSIGEVELIPPSRVPDSEDLTFIIAMTLVKQ